MLVAPWIFSMAVVVVTDQQTKWCSSRQQRNWSHPLMIFTFHCEIFSGKEAGAKSSKDSLLHIVGLSDHMDPLQRPRCHEGHPWCWTWGDAAKKRGLTKCWLTQCKVWETIPYQNAWFYTLQKRPFIPHPLNFTFIITMHPLSLNSSRKLASYICSSIPQSFFVGDWFEWHYVKYLKLFIECVFLDNGHHTLLVQASN